MHPGPKSLITGAAILFAGSLGALSLYVIKKPALASPLWQDVAYYSWFSIVIVTGLTGLAFLILSMPKMVDWLRLGSWSRRLGMVFFALAGIALSALSAWVVAESMERHRLSSMSFVMVMGGLALAIAACFKYAQTLYSADRRSLDGYGNESSNH